MNSAALSSMKDAGIASGAFHMYADAETLDVLQENSVDRLVVRTFQWDKPTISFGYLLDTQKVKEWAAQLRIENLDMVKRPTGGGAVLHTTSDLSFSLACRKDTHFFPDSPRACYEKIHTQLLKTLETFLGSAPPILYSPQQCSETSEKSSVPVCFNEPVCNDVMQDGKKVIGGALRITKNAVLYQGTIQLPHVSVGDLKEAVRRAFA